MQKSNLKVSKKNKKHIKNPEKIELYLVLKTKNKLLSKNTKRNTKLNMVFELIKKLKWK